MIDSVQFRARIGSFDFGRNSHKANKSVNYEPKEMNGVASVSLVFLLYLSLGLSLYFLDINMKTSGNLTPSYSSNYLSNLSLEQ